MKSRILASLIAVVMLICSTEITAFAKEDKWSQDTITISSEKEWNTLAKYCEKDSYSVGKTITLKKDIKLSKKAKMIPYFAGGFQGKHHTIEASFLEKKESTLGLFLHTSPDALIEDVAVKINLETEDEQSRIGGLVAEHRGTIKGCSFDGVVSGTSDVGGLVGVNASTGRILDSTSSGLVLGVHNTGGIAGRNLGRIENCINKSSVNVELYEGTLDVSTVERAIYQIWKTNSMEDTMPSTSDTGGICGYSSGSMISCENYGTIGYTHVGYNVGGIVGRQCGYVERCINYGDVKGRKDVGGVVGQAVPDVTIVYGQDYLGSIETELGNLEKLLQQTTSDAKDASTKVTQGVDKALEYAKSATESAENLEETDDVSESFESISQITDWEQESQRLQGALAGISDQLSILNQDMAGENQQIINDFNQVSNQFMVILDLFSKATKEAQSVRQQEVYEDISEEVIRQVTQGKVTECENESTVEGDVNVGGIVGNMAIEYDQDPEDDLSQAQDNSYRQKMQTKAVILDCNNNGKVTGKKNCVGGIAGRMDLGILVDCYSGGNIGSTTGDYVGGVCGYALSTIRRCSSKATLSGKDYVAGIAGIAGELTDSYSIAKIKKCERFAGAIAGEVKDFGQVSNNFFVNTGTAGIDRVSYDGIAQDISYDEMRQREDIPQQFQSFTITFLLDEEVIGTLERQYGESVTSEDFPKVKDKKDSYVLWECTEIASVKGNETLEGTYTAYADLLESEKTDGDGRPVILVEGKFRQGDELLIKDISGEINVKNIIKSVDSWLATMGKREVVGAYRVTIPKDGSKDHIIRYRVGEGDKKYKVYVKSGDAWKKTDALTSGKHLLVPVEGNTFEILVVQ